MRQVLEGALLTQMLIHASASLNLEKQTINELNVFPVPDGDTGTNMSLTIHSAATELQQKQPQGVGEVAAVIASAMLRGARGNSGVILSLLFRGFAKSVKDQEEIDGVAFAAAMSAGVTAAYKAVMKPAEGTVLTVSRRAAQRAEEAAQENNTLDFVLEQSIEIAELALRETRMQNPVLQKAGVVDAGGMGYLIILKSMLAALRGEVAPQSELVSSPQEAAGVQGFISGDITFCYCTEFICSRDTQRDPEALRAFLDSKGDSLVLVEDDEIIKVHVHTNHPGLVLEEALRYGALLTVKIENMRQQHSALLQGKSRADLGGAQPPALEPSPIEDVAVEVSVRKEVTREASSLEETDAAEPEKKYGFVAVCAGEGLTKVFEELGADAIISGGQTMNPSTADILGAINQTAAEIVYVLPNNKNIIMAAQQCTEMVENKRVIVLSAQTVPQGMSAMLHMDYEAEEAENTAAMEAAMQRVITMEITYAARDSEFDGQIIHAGDYLALRDNQLFGTEENLERLLARMALQVAEHGAEFITLFYGDDVQEREAKKAFDFFRLACPDAELTLLDGGQPVYSYLISAE